MDNLTQKTRHKLEYNVPVPNLFFIGRTKVLRDLHEELKKVSKLAIYGLGGIGKTQIVIQYIHQYEKFYDNIFWIYANTVSEIKSNFSDIAKNLNLLEKENTNLDYEVLVVTKWLESHDKWLLVFDNADKPEILKPFLPKNTRGHIILTSRAQVFEAIGISSPREIPLFTLEGSLEFLFKRTSGDSSDLEERNAALALATELGCLPLALEQAAAYIVANKINFQEYLKRYGNFSLALLEQSSSSQGNHEPIAITWQISFQELKKASQAATDVLHFSAFLNPDNIPYELITLGASKLSPSIVEARGKMNITELLKPLTCYSFINLPPNSDFYSIHCVLQEVLKKYEMDENRRKYWVEKAICVINHVFPSANLSSQERFEEPIRRRCQRLLPHAQNVANLVMEYKILSEASASLLNCVGYYSSIYGQYSEATPLLEKALEFRKQIFTTEHLAVAESLNNLAQVYRYQARYEEAERLYLDALTLRERLLSSQHLDVAKIRNNLAELYYSQARYDKAKPLYEKALKLREDLLEKGHVDIAESLHNLARLNGIQGNYQEAERLYKEALEINERHLGKQHPFYARNLYDLAKLYKAQGHYDNALEKYIQALEINQQVLAPDHPFIVIDLNNIANIYRILGRYNEAESAYLQALNLLKHFSETKPHRFAYILDDLALFYHEQGRYEEAEDLYEQALESRLEFLGKKHPDLAASLNNLALLYQQLGLYEEAKNLYYKSLDLYLKVLEDDNPIVAIIKNNLGEIYRLQGIYSEAQRLYEEALSLQKPSLGGSGKGVVIFSFILLIQIGLHSLASLLLQHYRLEKELPDLATSYNNLALVYFEQGQYKNAKKHYYLALKLYKKFFGKNHITVANCYNNLAKLYQTLPDYKQAKSNYDKALEICQQQDEDLFLTAAILDNLGSLYLEQESYELAEEKFFQALNLKQRMLGSEDLEIAQSLDNLAILYQKLQRYQEAEDLFKEALELRKQLLGEQDLEIAESLDNLAILYQELQRYQEAETILVQAFKIAEQTLGSEDSYTMVIRDHLKGVRDNLD